MLIRKNKELSLNKTILFNALSVFLIQGLSFLSAPIFSRMLGTDNYGIVAAFVAWQNILVIIFPLSVGSTISIAVNEFSKDKQHEYHSSILTLGLISTALFSMLILISGKVSMHLLKMSFPMMCCLLASVLFVYVINFANTRYTFELQAHKNFALAASNSLLMIGLSLVFIVVLPKEINYWGRIIGNMAAGGILAVIAAFLIYKEGGFSVKKEYIKFCLPLSIPAIFHALSNVILNQSDRIMLQSLSANSMAGIYSLAYSFTTILVAIYGAMNNSWVPFYFRFLGEKDREKMLYHGKNYLELFTLIAVGFLLVFREVYYVFADKTFWDGARVIPLLVIGFFFMFIYSFAINYEFYLKKTKSMALITTSAAVLNLVLNYYLITGYAFMGAAVATLVSYVFEFVAHYIYVVKVSKGDFPFGIGFFIKPSLMLAAGVAICYGLSGFAVVRWVLAVMVGAYIIYTIYKRKTIF